MKALESLAKNKNVQGVLAIAGLVGIAWWVYSRVKGEAAAAAQAVANVNQGTPYEGAGIIGTLGNFTNQALGGVPQSVGQSLGGWLYDLTHDDVATTQATPAASRKIAIGDNFYDQGFLSDYFGGGGR
jgi:hypothetical protein